MKIPVVKVDTENSDFQYIETLRRNRTKRHQSGEFFVEGVRSINQILSNGWEVNAFVYTSEKRLSDWASRILAGSRAKIHYELPLALLEKISQKEDTSELIALVAMPDDVLSRIPRRQNPLIVLVDRLASPGNLGTLIRSCDALGVDGLIMTGHAADLYAPETIRAAAGSFFSVPVVRLPSHNEFLPWLTKIKSEAAGFQVVGTSASAEIPIQAHDFTKPTLLLIGNENHGLSVNYRSFSDFMVKIPMSGSASSLNVACAASIILYEVARQRAA